MTGRPVRWALMCVILVVSVCDDLRLRRPLVVKEREVARVLILELKSAAKRVRSREPLCETINAGMESKTTMKVCRLLMRHSRTATIFASELLTKDVPFRHVDLAVPNV